MRTLAPLPVLLALLSACHAPPPRGTPPPANPPPPPPGDVSAARPAEQQLAKGVIQDITRTLGPFPIKGRQFTVVLHEKHITGVKVPDPEFQTTLASLEIRDDKGTVHYTTSFGFQPADSEFPDVLSASAELIQGRERNGILLSLGSLPSTPMGGSSWQVFGMFDDKLVPFSKPIGLEGELVDPALDGAVMKTVAEPGLQGEVINFKIWTGNFFAIYPVRLDFILTKAMPAWRCLKMTARGNVQRCQYRIEAARVVPEEEMTFVRLFGEADEGIGNPKHVVVRRNSRVEVLACEGEIRWEEDADNVSITPGDDFWVKVRIDGVEGWIHTQEDFAAIGLPQSG